jgi:hypothetical protein
MRGGGGGAKKQTYHKIRHGPPASTQTLDITFCWQSGVGMVGRQFQTPTGGSDTRVSGQILSAFPRIKTFLPIVWRTDDGLKLTCCLMLQAQKFNFG